MRHEDTGLDLNELFGFDLIAPSRISDARTAVALAFNKIGMSEVRPPRGHVTEGTPSGRITEGTPPA